MNQSKQFFQIIVLIFLLSFVIIFTAKSQNCISGNIVNKSNEDLAGVIVGIPNTTIGVLTNPEGKFHLCGLPESGILKINLIGYKSITYKFSFTQNQKIENLKLTLSEDVLGLEQVVVTANRELVTKNEAPILISTISKNLFQATQSAAISEGLSFSPGLRLENNCQNCGFTAVRMNSLAGPYTQMLINGRPIFSALNAVYGLEQIPASIVDRIEVVRGGGSALYGGNAIAGTINIITKDPIVNSWSMSSNLGLLKNNATDFQTNGHVSVVSDDLKKGLGIYASTRYRSPLDLNGDGFTELTRLRNQSIGLSGFVKPLKNARLGYNGHIISEYRRGGNNLNSAPHLADIAEQLQSTAAGGGITFEHEPIINKFRYSIYSSGQKTLRDSYYGGGGLPPNLWDSTNLEQNKTAYNAYGNTKDLIWVNGIQTSLKPNLSNNIQLLWVNGFEHQFNKVYDQMPGYNRSINQTISTLGLYSQADITIANTLFSLGGRFDLVHINGDYIFSNTSFTNMKKLPVFVPRIAISKNLSENLKFRFSYAEGYRAPQAFNEDLHIETVGGAARFIKLSPNLKVETSRSYTTSLDWFKQIQNLPLNITTEAFLTQLNNPFVNGSPSELPNGASQILKFNGKGLQVYGLNLELKTAFQSWLAFTGGLTFQQSHYQNPLIVWEPETITTHKDSINSTNTLLRAPNCYGYFNLGVNPTHSLKINITGVYTGSMKTPHTINPDNNFTLIKTTRTFLELNLKIAKHYDLAGDHQLEIFGGIQNLLNAFQTDFDRGRLRDASYVYGPTRPRTLFLGLKFSFAS